MTEPFSGRIDPEELPGLKRLAKDAFTPRVPGSIYIKPLDQEEWQQLGMMSGDVFFDETSEWSQEQIKMQAAMYKMATSMTYTFQTQEVSKAFMKLMFGRLTWPPRPLLHNGRKPSARRRRKR